MVYFDDNVQIHPRDGILSPAAGGSWLSASDQQPQPGVKKKQNWPHEEDSASLVKIIHLCNQNF